jgi:outer membrane protein assembly factor BamB
MGYDLARTGYDPAERTIGPGSFGSFQQVWTARIGGEVGEPVLAGNVNVAGSPVNILYVGSSGNGTISALNADTGAVVWSKQFPMASYNCGSSGPFTFGVTGAPVIDRATNRIYVPDGADAVHALDLASGTEQTGWPITIASPANTNFIESALTYNPANQMLYVETSSTCDISPWFGRVTAINTVSASVVNSFFPTQGQSGGGIWGFGGASVDTATNNVYIATGNADTNANPEDFSYAEQIVELSPDVSMLLANNHPFIPPGGDDEDFGATPLLFQPPGCGPLLAAVNKSGMFYLYSRFNINGGPVQAIQMSITTGNGDFIGIPAYDPVTNDVYVGLPATFGIYQPGVAAFALRSDCTINPVPVWAANFGTDGEMSDNDTPRSPIAIANGVLYVGDYLSRQSFAFNASTGEPLWSQGTSGVVGAIVSNGKLYLGSTSQTLTVWAPQQQGAKHRPKRSQPTRAR